MEDKYFKTEHIPEWFHLVLWGNEHEPIETLDCHCNGFRIFYAGSTISTSLGESETKVK